MSYIYNLTDTWNSAGTTFTAIKMNVTDTASAAGSKILDFQIGGVSKLTLDKSGNMVATGIQSGSLSLTQALGISSGGTGASTPSGARVALFPSLTGNGTKVLAVNAATTDVEWVSVPGGGSVTSVNASGGSTGLTFNGGPITSSGTLTLGGVLALASGGTGSGTAAGARVNILPAYSSNAGKFLAVNALGTDVEWTIPTAGAASGLNNDITSMTGITGGISSPDFIQFDTTATVTPATGRLYFNEGEGGLSYVLKGGNVVQEVGQSQQVLVYNGTGATILKGQAVYSNGAQGQRPTVALALATSDATSARTLGIAAENILNGAEGWISTLGIVENINTSAFAEGAQLYLSGTTAGGLTATKTVAPIHMVYVARCIKSHVSAGRLFVTVQNGYEMDELHDVSAVSPANNDGLFYNTATSLWEKKSIPTALGYTPYNVTNPNGYTSNVGTVTSVAGTGTVSGLSLSGTVTSAGSITLGGTLAVTAANFASQTTKTFLAAPNAANGVPTFRTILASDIPTLNQDTTGTASNITNNSTYMLSRGSVLAANVDTATLNGFYSQTNASDSQGLLVFNPGGSLGPLQMTFTYGGLMQFRNKTDSTNWNAWKTVVTGVSGTAPISSSGGATPAISISAATTSAAGSMSAADKTKLDGIATSANNYTLPKATATTLGGVELFDATVQTVAANAVTTTASRTYGVQLNAADQLVVNVPWSDTSSGGTVTSVTGTAPIVSSGGNTPAISLADTTVTAGTYTNATLTVDAKGRLTAASSGSAGGTGTVTSVGGTGTVSGLTLTGTVTTTGSLTLGGTLSLTSGNVTTALGFTPYNATNPSNYITSSALTPYALLSGATFTGAVAFPGGSNVATNGDIYARRSSGTTGVYYFADGGSKYLYWDGGQYVFGNAGPATTTTSFRAPIFYDSDDTTYYTNPASNSVINGIFANRYFQRASGVPTNNLGDPTVTEMALFEEQFNNKTAFFPPANVICETSTDGTTWTLFAVSDAVKKNLVGGTSGTGLGIPYGTAYFRVRFVNDGNYVYLNALYSSWSGNGHQTKVQIHTKAFGSTTWAAHTNSDVLVSSWPGHLYLPFSTIAYHPGTYTDEVAIVFIPTWNASFPSNSISLQKMQIWGGYPQGKRTAFSIDADKNYTFPSDVRATLYYDSSNTAYSVDPASTSNLNIVTTAGYIQTYSGGVKWDESGTRSWSMYPSGGAMLLNSGDGGGSFTVGLSGGTRSPIFYDTNDTTYYVDPNSTSVMNAIQPWGEVGMRRGDSGTLLRSYNTSASQATQFYVNHNLAAVEIGNARGIVYAGGTYWQIANSTRSPIFYDSDNTAYYVDPNSTSNLLGLTVTNTITGSITGNAATATSATSATSATNALRIVFNDGPRDLSDRLPNSFTRTVNWDFVGAGTGNGTGNYAGVMTFAPWIGTTASTGDSSYQLAFANQSGVNASGPPRLSIRSGIDTTWGAWHILLTSSNYNDYAPTKTGGGASGTWGISITGNAATITSQANSATITASTGINGNQIVQRDANGYIYANYINFNQSESENPTISSFLTSNGDGWARKSSLAHAKNSIRGVADGTWGINVTGSAASLGSTNFIERTGSTGDLNTDFQNTPAGTMRYHGDSNAGTNAPSAQWWIYESKRHSNATNYWGTQVAWGWEDAANRLRTRNVTNGTFGGWIEYLNTAGHTFSGDLNMTGSIISTASDVRAPIFYDQNNTAYYVNPNGASRLSGDLNLGNFSNIRFNGTTYAAGVSIIEGYSTGFSFYPTGSTNGITFNIYGTYTDVVNAIRSPIYYDRNNTAYYADPATGSVFSGATFDNLITGRNSASTDVNTANDTGSISIRGSTTTVAAMSFHRAGAYAINMGLGTDNVFRIGGWSASNNCFQMDGSGNLTMLNNVTAYSDIRLKKDIVKIDNALEKVLQLNGYTYTRIDTGNRQMGVIAQEVIEVIPEVVLGSEETNYSVAYGNMVGLLIEAIKEQQEQINELKKKIGE